MAFAANKGKRSEKNLFEMAEEEQHETFESVGSGASLTYPLQVIYLI